MIHLAIEPNIHPMTWREFISMAPPGCIALDGYVRTGPRFNPRGPWANFNHHEEVSRLETRATCAQVLIGIRQGLLESFRDKNGNVDVGLFVNDCDEDVCMSVFLFENHVLVSASMNPILNRLVFMEDMMDTTGGMYPFPKDLGMLRELMWVFAPYHRFRTSGEIDKRNDEAFRDVIGDVGRRIMAHITGKGEEVKLDTRYKNIGGGPGWSMIKEVGANARMGVYGDGIKSFVAVRERSDGRFVYTLGRSSQFVPFPIPKLLKTLSAKEASASNMSKRDYRKHMWGGSDIIAGSPRANGSALNPSTVSNIINQVLTH